MKGDKLDTEQLLGGRPRSTWLTARQTIVFLLVSVGMFHYLGSRRDSYRTKTEVGVLKHTGDISACPGYDLSLVKTTSDGLTGRLSLAGDACNAYGKDYQDLVLEVEYQTTERIHVNIYDSSKSQYEISENLLPRPTSTHPTNHDIYFNYTTSPFEFWITRSSDHQIIFDTRSAHIPTHHTPIQHDGKNVRDSTMPGHPLIFSDQYLQLSTALPENANIYGLGEVIATSGLRRDPNGTIATFWNRDSGGSPVDATLYGSHPFYLETRWDAASTTGSSSQSHGVFLRNSHGMDVVLRSGALQFRAIGGTFDFYFMSGPTPQSVLEQYTEVIGRPTKMPSWAFGFHLLRWGYPTIEATRGVVEKMEKAQLPLEAVWNDLDYMYKHRNFDLDDTFASTKFRDFTDWLHSRDQLYIPLVDLAIGVPSGDEDRYDTYEKGHELDVFIKDDTGENEYVGQVWPGPTVFPDWTAKNVQTWWKWAFDAFREKGVQYDGIWLDMNEPASFVRTHLRDRRLEVGIEVDDSQHEVDVSCSQKNKLNYPPYAIHDGWDGLQEMTVPPASRLSDGTRHYHSHNLNAFQETMATYRVLKEQMPDKRPFIVSRGTFAGQGRFSAHWLGDNYSTWKSMLYSIQGVLQFQMYGIPMVGPDTCGFGGNTTEELCNRWMQLSAFFPFYRNHNIEGAIDQEPYQWDSVSKASAKVLSARYALLPYWESLFISANKRGTPPLRPLFFQFGHQKYAQVDTQFMVGKSLLVTPVLEQGAQTVTGYFPSERGTTWRSLWSDEVVVIDDNDQATLDAPLGTIPVHMRSGTTLLVYSDPGNTITSTKKSSGYHLVVYLDHTGVAEGEFFLDDGTSVDSAETQLTVSARPNRVSIQAMGDYAPMQMITRIKIMGGVDNDPRMDKRRESGIVTWDERTGVIVLDNLNVKVQGNTTVEW